MKPTAFYFSLGLLVSCTSHSQQPVAENVPVTPNDTSEIHLDSSIIDSVQLGIDFFPSGTYTDAKNEIRRLKTTNNSGKDFENYLVNKIIPHWYGTEWDFNGYTAVPNQGVIACGYFVSTTLLHLGINVNRYHLAQQAGLNEAKSLAITEDHYFTVYGYDSLEATMLRDYEDGIYFVGLDNHVGYLYKKNKGLYFIHSNYIEDKVMIEKAEYSDAFSSNIYVVAELSTNEALLEKWRTGMAVKVYRE